MSPPRSSVRHPVSLAIRFIRFSGTSYLFCSTLRSSNGKGRIIGRRTWSINFGVDFRRAWDHGPDTSSEPPHPREGDRTIQRGDGAPPVRRRGRAATHAQYWRGHDYGCGGPGSSARLRRTPDTSEKRILRDFGTARRRGLPTRPFRTAANRLFPRRLQKSVVMPARAPALVVVIMMGVRVMVVVIRCAA